MVIEIVTFRLARGVDETTFLVADQRVQIEYMHQQHGFVRRTTARGANGEWVVVTLWDSEHNALASAASSLRDSAAAAFATMVEVLEIKRFEALD